MSRWLLLWSIFFFAQSLQAQVVINELHVTPPDSQPQWLELVNISATSIELANCKIGSHRFERDMPTIIVQSGAYAIVTADTAAFLTVWQVPAGTLLVQVADLPSFNRSSAGGAVLRAADGSVLDTVAYNPSWGTSGKSLERRDTRAPATSQQNLAASAAPLGSTPGRLNSIALVDTDVAPIFLRYSPESSNILVLLQNRGRNALQNVVVKLFNDVNNNGRAESTELFSTSNPLSIPAADTATAIFSTGNLVGEVSLLAITAVNGDERPENDTLFAAIYISATESFILINEFMYNPLDGNGEYVEFANISDQDVNIRNWVLHRKAGSTGRADSLIIDRNFIVPANGYAVCTWDTAFFTGFPQLVNNPAVYFRRVTFNLSSTDDQIVLRDPARKMIDSLAYDDNWHNLSSSARKGRSLEKLSVTLPSADRQSWTSSGAASGGTPTAENSVAVELPTEGTLAATPNPFSRSSSSGLCVISFRTRFAQARVTIQLYDGRGVPVKSLLNAEFSASEGVIQWDGTNNNGAPLQSGAYICLMEAVDISSGESEITKLLIAIRP